MRKLLIIFFLLTSSSRMNAQNFFEKHLPTSAYVGQYAGSVGLLSAGYFRQTPRQRLEAGLMYGYVPQSSGGPLHAFTLKLIYNPFNIKLSKRLQFEPVQAGFFITAWLGENIDISWSGRYPRGYYWWQSSARKHIFLSTQLSWTLKDPGLDRLSVFFETNTNDLYLYNYVPNPGSVGFYDILFFGFGCKLYTK